MLHEIIQTISNIPISTILTISMIVLLLLSVLFGFLRGLKKSIFYIVFYLIGIVVFFISLGGMTNALLNFNLSGMNIRINGILIESLNDSVPEVLRSFLAKSNDADLSGMFVKGSESYILVTSLLTFAAQLVLTIGFIVVFQIVYRLIIWILWLIFGKKSNGMRRVSVKGKVINPSKNRLLGGVMGLVPGLISIFMLFVPISGIFSVASSLTAGKDQDGVSFGDYLSEEDYRSLQKALGSYEESAPGKVFNIIVSQDGTSLDVMIFDKITSVRIDDRDINIRKDLENIGRFASTMISSGLFDVLSNDNFTTNELIEIVKENSDEIKDAFAKLGDAQLIDLVMNTGIEYLDSSRLVNEKMELSTESIYYENLKKLDWSSEFGQIGSILNSIIDVLDVLPEEEKNKPMSQLSSFNSETMDELDSDKATNALNNFVDELFKSSLINEAAYAGLEYVYNRDNIKEIVGEVDSKALRNVDLKDDLVKVVSALESVIVISINNFTNINLQNLSNQSVELKNIIDELLELGVFKVVEDHVIDYAITNYVEKDPNISKFVDVEELRKLKRADFKVELGALVETFGKLGEQTDLFDLEEVEDKNALLNYNAINSKCLEIINENVEESNSIYKFLNQALEAAFVPKIYKSSEDYQESVSKFEGATDEETRSNWVAEIDVFTKLLSSVENEMLEVDEEFSLFDMATNSNGQIKLGVLKGLAAKDLENSSQYNDAYYLDESIFVKDIMMNTVASSASGNTLFDGLFDDPNLEYGKELDTLIKVMEEGDILESTKNDYVIEFATLEEKFYRINDVKLNAYSNHIGDSILLQRIVRKNLNGQINNALYTAMEDWSSDRWNGEFRALSNILIDGGIVGHEELSFDEMFNSFEEINYSQMKAIKDNISPSDPNNDVAFDEVSKSNDKSLIVRDIMINILTIETDDSGKYVVNPETNEFVVKEGKENLHNDLLTLGDSGWRNEIGTLAEIVKSETYIDDNGNYSSMSLDELTSINCIRPETLDVIADNIDKTILIKDAIKDPIRDLLVEEENDESIDSDDVLYSDPNSWTNEEWKKELKSLAYVAYPLASSNAEKEASGYPNDRTYLDFNNLSIDGKIKLQVLENLMGESEDTNTFMNSLRRFFRINTLKSKELNNSIGINHSSVLQKIFRDAMNDSINKPENVDDLYIVDFDSFTNDQYYYEVESIYNVVLDANLYEVDSETNEEYVVFENISNALKDISKSEFSAISSNVPNSKILQKQVQKTLKDNFDENFVMEMNEWDSELWQSEMNSLNEVVQTLDEDSNTGAINFEISGKVKVVTIESVRNNHQSKIVREAMSDTVDELLVIEPMNSSDVASPLGEYQYVSPIKSCDFNDFQWKYELNTLYEISGHLAEGEGEEAYIDTANLTENFKKMEISLFEVVTDLVYGDNTLNGVSVKTNSYILQAQLSPSIETLMNAGKRITSERVRLLHPESYVNVNEGANWNEDANVPKYEASDITNPIDNNYVDPNDEVGKWWSKELNAIYSVALEKFGADGSFDIDGIDFGNTKISTLNSIGDYIDESYVLQSCMRDTIDGVMNQEAEGGALKFSKYDYLTSEYWNGEKWQVEIRAIRDVAKSLSKINGETPATESTFKERNEYTPSNWIIDKSLDNQYTFGLFGMSIEDSNEISLDTLYFTSVHAEDSLIVRSLLRTHIIDIINVDKEEVYDDDFMTEWALDSNVEDYKSRWDYEIAALFNISGRMANSNGTLSLKGDMFEVIPQDVIYAINGSFDDSTGNVVVDSNNHGYVANDENNDYKSNIITSLLTTSLTTEKVNPRLWGNDEWRYEINALSSVSEYLAVDGMINLSSNPVENGINIHLLDCLSNVINQSTYMQEKIESSLYVIDENLNNEKKEELENAYPKFGFSIEKNQWNGEIKALYNVLNGTSYVAGRDTPSNLEDDLFDYNNINFSSTSPMRVDIFRNISANINQSTYLQSKLEGTIEGLVPAKYDSNTGDENPYYVLDREEYFDFDFESTYNGITCTHKYDLPDCDHKCSICGYTKDYHLERTIDSLGNKTYSFNIKIRYDDENYHAWSVELKTIFGIMLDPAIELVDDKGTSDVSDDEIILDDVVENLHTLSVKVLTLTGDKLDEFGHDAYHSSNVVRLNLIRPLEELAYNTNADEDEVAAFDAMALIDYKKGFKWIDEPLDIYQSHEFDWSYNSVDDVYNVTSVDADGVDHLHRYNGNRTFTYNNDGSVNVSFEGWNTSTTPGTYNYIYNLNETLTLLSETSTTKTYIKYGLDRDGNEHELYKMDINNDGTGYWYCINKYSDLHELETFFKLIGATNLQEAKDKLTLSSTNTMLDILNLLRERDVLDETKYLANESYLIGQVFTNRGINIQLYN